MFRQEPMGTFYIQSTTYALVYINIWVLDIDYVATNQSIAPSNQEINLQ